MSQNNTYRMFPFLLKHIKNYWKDRILYVKRILPSPHNLDVGVLFVCLFVFKYELTKNQQ